MCDESLVEGGATDRSLSALLRAKLRDAVKNGVAAAVIVVAVLSLRVRAGASLGDSTAEVSRHEA